MDAHQTAVVVWTFLAAFMCNIPTIAWLLMYGKAKPSKKTDMLLTALSILSWLLVICGVVQWGQFVDARQSHQEQSTTTSPQ